MDNLTLAERFAIMALNSKCSNYRSTEKKSVLLLLIAADYLDNHYDEESQRYQISERELKSYMKKTSPKKIEKKIVEGLKKKELIEEIKSLLGCDLFYDKNSMKI